MSVSTGRGAAMKTSKRGWSPAKLATTGALVSTGTVFVRYKMNAPAAAAKDAMMAQGLMDSFVALCGNTAASLLRKQVSRVSDVKPAEQAGIGATRSLEGVSLEVLHCRVVEPDHMCVAINTHPLS